VAGIQICLAIMVAAAVGSRPPQPGGTPAVSRRERLETIQQREAMKDMLIVKYRDRFKNRSGKQLDEVSLATATIDKEVGKFLGSSAAITQANLARLERRLQMQARGDASAGLARDADGLDSVSVVSVSAYTMGSTPAGSMGMRAPLAGAGPLTARHPTPRGPRATQLGPRPGNLSARGRSGGAALTAPLGDSAYATSPAVRAPAACASTSGAPGLGRPENRDTELEWSVLDKLAAQLHQKDSARAKMRELELKQKLKSDLDKQMLDTHLKQEREKQLDLQYGALADESTKQWSDQEHAKQAKKIEQIQSAKREQEEQVAKLQDKRAEEKSREQREAKEMMELANHHLERDKQLAEERLKTRFDLAQQALRESSDALVKREEQKQLLDHQEKDALEAYEKKREQREQDEGTRKQQANILRSHREGLAAMRVATEKLSEDSVAAKAMEERIAKDGATELREKADRKRLDSLRHSTQEYILNQMKEKQTLKAVENEKMRLALQRQAENAKRVEASEKERETSRRRQNCEHKVELERQIAAKASRGPGKEVMSECELRLNRHLLEKVTLALTDLSA